MLDQNEAIKLTCLAKIYWCHSIDLFTSIVCEFWRWVRIRNMVFQHATSYFDHLHSRFIYIYIYCSCHHSLINKSLHPKQRLHQLPSKKKTWNKLGFFNETRYTPPPFLGGTKAPKRDSKRSLQDRGCGSSVWNGVFENVLPINECVVYIFSKTRWSWWQKSSFGCFD